VRRGRGAVQLPQLLQLPPQPAHHPRALPCDAALPTLPITFKGQHPVASYPPSDPFPRPSPPPLPAGQARRDPEPRLQAAAAAPAWLRGGGLPLRLPGEAGVRQRRAALLRRCGPYPARPTRRHLPLPRQPRTSRSATWPAGSSSAGASGASPHTPARAAGVIEDDGGAVHACLREHEDNLSPDCKA
jgi:hypothetical protein